MSVADRERRAVEARRPRPRHRRVLGLRSTRPRNERKLLAYVALLAKWNRRTTSPRFASPPRMVTHHLLDSLAVAAASAAARGRCACSTSAAAAASRHPARDRAARLARVAGRSQSQEGGVPDPGRDRAAACATRARTRRASRTSCRRRRSISSSRARSRTSRRSPLPRRAMSRRRGLLVAMKGVHPDERSSPSIAAAGAPSIADARASPCPASTRAAPSCRRCSARADVPTPS